MTFEEWADKRGVWPRLTHEEIWNAAAEAEREAYSNLRMPPGTFDYRTGPSPSREYDDGFCDGIRALEAAIKARSNVCDNRTPREAD
jgi:hypothetical protein